MSLIRSAPVLILLPMMILGSTRIVQGQTDCPPSRIALTTEVVSLTVAVKDREGRHLPGLTRESFAVYEQNVAQEISYFSNADMPARVAVVFDASGSMSEEKLERAQRALRNFIAFGHPDDRYDLIGFNEGSEVLIEDVKDGSELVRAASRLRPRGDTALFEAIATALARLSRQAGPKRALLIISDGEDNRSRLSLAEVKRLLQESDVTAYTVLIGTPRRGGVGGAVLEALAAASGGASFFPRNEAKMEEAFAQIALELRSRYSIGYTPSNPIADQRWRAIKVRVTPSPGSEPPVVRARPGYFPRSRAEAHCEPLADEVELGRP